jgi:purine catabolism regulator
VKLGRRLVFPVVLNEIILGYVSVMTRQQDDLSALSEYMYALSVACKVGFSHRLKDTPVLSITMKGLLKDFLCGSPLSSSDQERIERHFGFDLFDGFMVLAVEAELKNKKEQKDVIAGAQKPLHFPDDRYVSLDVDGIRIFVLPWSEKDKNTWQELAQIVVGLLKERNDEIKICLGASRPVKTLLDLPDAFMEARQTLVIGSMLRAGEEFQLSYRELGVKRLLYLICDHPELERFLEETLEPLEAYDQEWESELVDTLRSYLAQGANLNSTARSLFIHRHTLRYRLEQIADILKVDIDSQEVLLNLQIACLIRDMKGDARKRGG